MYWLLGESDLCVWLTWGLDTHLFDIYTSIPASSFISYFAFPSSHSITINTVLMCFQVALNTCMHNKNDWRRLYLKIFLANPCIHPPEFWMHKNIKRLSLVFLECVFFFHDITQKSLFLSSVWVCTVFEKNNFMHL